MSLLSQIHRGRRPAPRRCMIHGSQGVGKSTFAAMSDHPIFIHTEEGLGEVDCASFPLCHTFADCMTALTELAQGEHNFKTVAVDTLDWLERLIWQDVCAAENVVNIEKIGFQKGYAYALNYWRAFLEALDVLRRQRAMTVVLTAHTKIEKFQTPEDSAFDRFAPRLHKLASAVVMEWADEVLFATYSTTTDPKRIRPVPDAQGNTPQPDRIMRTSEGPTHVAKNRVNMPYELPLEWAAYDYYVQLAHRPAEQAAPAEQSK